MIGTKFLEQFLRYNRDMAKLYIKSDENSKLVAELLEKYIRQSTAHNLSVKEENADFCVSLKITEYPEEQRLNAYFYNNAENMNLRLFSIPLEDIIYCLSLMLLPVLIMDYLKNKNYSPK